MNEIFSRWIGAAVVGPGENNWIHLTIVIVEIALIVLVANVVCRRLIIPLVKKIISRTRSTWDDVFFNDSLLLDVSRLVSPILIAVLIPMAFVGKSGLIEFLLKVNYI